MLFNKSIATALLATMILGLSLQTNATVCIGNISSSKCTSLDELNKQRVARQNEAINNTKIHALFVGIEEYQNAQYNLPGVKNETRMMKKLFSERLNPESTVTVLNELEKTNRNAIIKALDDMSQKVKKDDLFVFYFSGHTIANENGTYLLSSDRDGKNDYRDTAISSDVIFTKLRNIPSEKKFIIFDSNNAHHILDGRPAIGRDSMIMSATSGNSQALVNSKGSLYTSSIIKAMQGEADKNNDSILTSSEIAAFVDLDTRINDKFNHDLRPSYISFGKNLLFRAPAMDTASR